MNNNNMNNEWQWLGSDYYILRNKDKLVAIFRKKGVDHWFDFNTHYTNLTIEDESWQ